MKGTCIHCHRFTNNTREKESINLLQKIREILEEQVTTNNMTLKNQIKKEYLRQYCVRIFRFFVKIFCFFVFFSLNENKNVHIAKSQMVFFETTPIEHFYWILVGARKPLL